MPQGKQQLQFERNPLIKYRINCKTDDGRTMGQRARDECRFHKLCGHSQAELNIISS